MHKKDRVKEVIEKYVALGKDFFELTPSYLVQLDELKGYSERTLKRGRTEYKNEHLNILKGKSKASVNLKKKVIAYLEKNPDSTKKDLQNRFSKAEKTLLNEAMDQWTNSNSETESIKVAEKKGYKGSLRQKVFSFLDDNPAFTLSKLEKAFPDHIRPARI